MRLWFWLRLEMALKRMVFVTYSACTENCTTLGTDALWIYLLLWLSSPS
jgi:hypothetical protein